MTEQAHQPRKRFGQNFLHDQNIIQSINRSIAAKSSDNMVEIGPGQGALTEPLLQKLDHLNVIELDRDLIPLLQKKFGDNKLTIFEQDALKFDFNQLINEQPLRVVGNLPYNISTPLMFHLFSYNQGIKDMHFMLQLEVVDRLAAAPGSKTYGRLSVLAQYFCQIDKLFNVPPTAFFPAPKVMSAIVRLVPRPKTALIAENEKLLAEVVKACFSMRRKTLRNNLKQLLDSAQLEQLSIDLTARAEQISVPQYVTLSNEINTLLNNN